MNQPRIANENRGIRTIYVETDGFDSVQVFTATAPATSGLLPSLPRGTSGRELE